MKTLAAVLVQTGHPLELLDLELPALKAGQVLVEVRISGICHTQLLEVRGHRGKDAYLPHCLGHEGVGDVLEIGQGVSKVKPGDAVILSWIKGSGADVPGLVYRDTTNRRTVNAGGITTFQRYAVVSENRLTVMSAGVPIVQAALLGCAVPTGVGAVLNTAGAGAGDSIAVFGCGGVGLCAVAGAASVNRTEESSGGASPVIAIDVIDAKLKLAVSMGATHTINASDSGDDVVERVLAIESGGVDIAIEATGLPAVMRQAFESVKPRGGRAVVIGNARFGSELTIDPAQLNQGKQLRGTWGGDSQPDRDYQRYGDLLASGTIDLSPLMSEPFSLERVNEALDALESGAVARPMIDMRLDARSDEASCQTIASTTTASPC